MQHYRHALQGTPADAPCSFTGTAPSCISIGAAVMIGQPCHAVGVIRHCSCCAVMGKMQVQQLASNKCSRPLLDLDGCVRRVISIDAAVMMGQPCHAAGVIKHCSCCATRGKMFTSAACEQ
ncbi:hypothetical protein HPP92_025299 [Vanilla planifolia]|uniref:Uncharacterized protein n=1 Tax=Vanilla planifolia TaxID=51239 RepID=A0A835PH01_VANPL|nr:hypothetical protein HPP92_025653 [Vanilla planifolia]KAG0453993.1 hypothetical protein HPP92_025297 [Vanilla planifolia]KAG0453995.1 hypothetical protein HPP92_025299 [Vanilla planifolia]